MAVGRLAVEHELTGELDLVRRVVRVEPGRRGVAKSHLQHRGRHDEHHDDEREDGEPGGAPTHLPPADDCDRAQDRAGDDRGAAHEAEVPPAVGSADERPEDAARVSAPAQRPRVAAEQRHVHGDERTQNAEQGERPPAVDDDVHVAASRSRVGCEEGTGQPEDEPREWILEEAAVRERVNEEPEQHGGKRQAEPAVDPVEAHEGESFTSDHEQVEHESDYAELGGDGQRRGVRDVERRRPAAVGEALAGPRLRAEPDSDQRVVADHAR